MNKAGFMKDALILFVITLVSGCLLGGVYQVTKEPIEKATIAANNKAYKAVFKRPSHLNRMMPLQPRSRDATQTWPAWILAVSRWRMCLRQWTAAAASWAMSSLPFPMTVTAAL